MDPHMGMGDEGARPRVPDKGHLGGEGKDLRLTPWAAGQGMWEEGRLAGNPHAFSEANRGKNKPG